MRAVGLSNHDVAQLEAAERIGHVDTLQPPFSAIRRETGAELAAVVSRAWNGRDRLQPDAVGAAVRTLFGERAAALPADDWRSRNADFKGEALERNLTFVDAFGPVAERHGVSIAASAIAWTLAWPGVSGAIVGARSPAQVEGWLAAATLELTPEDMDEIARAIDWTGAGAGPVRPAALDSSRIWSSGSPRRRWGFRAG